MFSVDGNVATSSSTSGPVFSDGFHRLKSVAITGGFLDGMTIDFTDGLNCLIGPRGTGKTTVLEFVRYALNAFGQDGDGDDARKKLI